MSDSDFKQAVDACCLNLRKLSDEWGVKYNTAQMWSKGVNPAPKARIEQLKKLKKAQDRIFKDD